jgi:hypothetical protein
MQRPVPTSASADPPVTLTEAVQGYGTGPAPKVNEMWRPLIRPSITSSADGKGGGTTWTPPFVF